VQVTPPLLEPELLLPPLLAPELLLPPLELLLPPSPGWPGPLVVWPPQAAARARMLAKRRKGERMGSRLSEARANP
jgi:hypothetical protein